MDPTGESPIRGRGAQSGAVSSRFGLATREVDGDWRDHMEALALSEGELPVRLKTSVTEERPRTILSFNQSPDIFFDRSVNAYRGCENGYTLLIASTVRFRLLRKKGLMSDCGVGSGQQLW